MLDDLHFIHERDKQDAIGVAVSQLEFFSTETKGIITDLPKIDSVVVSGMSGSALPAVMLPVWPGIKVPFEIVRGYDIPAYVGEHTLFIASSYSGNTEETLSAFEQALSQGAYVVVVSTGGALMARAKETSRPLFEIPSGIQPRMATFYFLAIFASILNQANLTLGSIDELKDVADWLRPHIESWKPDSHTKQNLAKKTALDLMGKTPIIYSGPKLFPATNKWKISINENAKNTAWCNQYPEFNHNEFIGWSSHPVQKPFAVVELHSNLEHPRIGRRFEISERLLSGLRPAPHAIDVEGDTILKQLAWATILGDFTSIYLGLLNGVDPTEVDLVEKLKKELK